jgi:hypothetical protein
MAENEEGTVSEEPETQPEAAAAAPEPEPPPAPGVPKEDYVSVRGLSGRARRMRRSEYQAMKKES